MDKGLRILLIDDNPDDRSLVQREIRKVLPDALVDEVGADEEFEAVLAGPASWDVVVTDYQLRWSTGLEVFRRLRRERPALPVIMFTASGSEAIAVEALKEGLDDYITKTVRHYGRIPCAIRASAERHRRRRAAEVAAAELRDKETRLQLALDAAAMDSWEYDPKTGRAVLHGRSRQIFGPLRREFATEQLFARLHPDDRERVRAQFLAAVAGVARLDAEFRIAAREGGERWLRAAAILDTAGGTSRLVGVLEDITRRKALEGQLREADRQKNEFIATLAHELRNPLAPIRYMAQLLRPGSPDGTVAKAREVIERQVVQMGRLLDDLLDVSRITLNRIELRRERLDLGIIAGQVADDLRPAAEAAGLALSLAVPAAPVWVEGDPVRLHEVVDNLLHNALKFTRRGGQVSLSLEREGGEAVLQVADDGIGIAPDMLDRIFDTFVQASTGPASSTPGGLGIGLTVVRRMVALHGGEVEARSAGLGRGARFIVRLPLVGEAAPQAADELQPAARGRGGRLRILVADDQPDAAESLALMLKLQGHALTIAHDGEEAKAAAEREPPDVMVLDIGMPRASGLEVARWARSQPWGGTVRLVAVTGWGRKEDRQRTREAGFDVHLVKPVDMDALLRACGQDPG